MKYQTLAVDLTMPLHHLKVIIPILGTLVGFIIFWFTYQSDRYKQRLITKHGLDWGLAKIVIHTKILGGLVMGLLPAIVYKMVFPETALADFGWSVNPNTLNATLVWTLGFGTFMAWIIGRNAKKPENLAFYPQIRSKQWSKKMVRQNLLGWTVYLLGYEALFRGVLFFPLLDQLGLWPAIAINVALYSATHIPKGLKETLGSIPLSIILCLLCAHTGNIWIAVFTHIAMSWTNTLISLKHNPEMVVIDA